MARMNQHDPLIVTLDTVIGVDLRYKGVFSFAAEGSEHHEYFQAMAKRARGSRPHRISDFYISEGLIKEIMVVRMLDLKKTVELPSFDSTVGATITFENTVTYAGLSLDSMAGEVHVFKIPKESKGGFGYGELMDNDQRYLLKELRIPEGLLRIT